MIGVSQNDVRVEVRRLKLFKANPFHRACRAHRHEYGSFNHGARSRQNSRARFAVASGNFEVDWLSFHSSLTAEDSREYGRSEYRLLVGPSRFRTRSSSDGIINSRSLSDPVATAPGSETPN